MADPIIRPFYRHLGIIVVEAANGHAVVRMPENPNLANVRGDVHGGAIAGLLDAALSTAARTAVEGSVTTIQLTTHFLAPGRGELVAKAHCVRPGRTIVTAEGTVTDADGTLVAQAIGTWRALTRR